VAPRPWRWLPTRTIRNLGRRFRRGRKRRTSARPSAQRVGGRDVRPSPRPALADRFQKNTSILVSAISRRDVAQPRAGDPIRQLHVSCGRSEFVLRGGKRARGRTSIPRVAGSVPRIRRRLRRIFAGHVGENVEAACFITDHVLCASAPGARGHADSAGPPRAVVGRVIGDSARGLAARPTISPVAQRPRSIPADHRRPCSRPDGGAGLR